MRPTQADESLFQIRLLGPILAALGIVTLVFIIYELAERLWLSELNPEWTYWFHIGRGLISSLIAAGVVAWLMYRASMSLRATALSASDWARGERPVIDERRAYYAAWLIQLRWIVVVVGVGLVIFAIASAMLEEAVWRPIIAIIAIAALLNLGYMALSRQRWLNRYLLPAQAYADLIILAALLHFSGGIENPLWIVLIFHVAIAGIVLERHQCYAIAGTATLLFALVIGGEALGLLDHHLLKLWPHVVKQGELIHSAHAETYALSMIGVLTVTLFLVAYFVTTLSERIRLDERQLAALADNAMEGQRLLEQSLMTTGTGLCVLDRDLNLLWKNARWESWFREIPVAAVRRAFSGTGEYVTEITGGTVAEDNALDGNTAPVYQLTIGSLRDNTGHIGRIVLLAQDITQRKKVQSQMVRAERLAAVGELAGHVAHEVNNPVGIISAKSRLLLSDRGLEMSEKVKQELEKITGLADRVTQITQGLLSYCRPSPAARHPLDIREPIREAVGLVAERARKLGVQIEDRLGGSLPMVDANADEIEQVTLNLLLNALDAMPGGGRLVLSAAGEPKGSITVCVEDTGSGIPLDIQKSVFEPFFTTKACGQGTGLGLSVCAGLIRSHGGSIDIESEPGQGTRVKIKLPAAGTVEGP